MAEAVRNKIWQNPTIEEELVNTGNRLLAEASVYDKFWGIGKDRSDPEANDYTKWPGQNKLGCILMHIRDEVMKEK